MDMETQTALKLIKYKYDIRIYLQNNTYEYSMDKNLMIHTRSVYIYFSV